MEEVEGDGGKYKTDGNGNFFKEINGTIKKSFSLAYYPLRTRIAGKQVKKYTSWMNLVLSENGEKNPNSILSVSTKIDGKFVQIQIPMEVVLYMIVGIRERIDGLVPIKQTMKIHKERIEKNLSITPKAHWLLENGYTRKSER